MLARFDDDVIAEKPDLVIWQVGTNAVLRDRPLAPAGTQMHEGLRRAEGDRRRRDPGRPQFARR